MFKKKEISYNTTINQIKNENISYQKKDISN